MTTDPVYYRGSLDPFEDIRDQLDRMGVAYGLVIGMSESDITHTWSNAGSWGKGAVENFMLAFDAEMEDQLTFAMEDDES
jgi:hypothetical protein